MFHFRTHGGSEVDIGLEADDGRLGGIEVKASATVGSGDLRGLGALREVAGARFHRGVDLYTGRDALPFGSGLWAPPMNALWHIAAAAARTALTLLPDRTPTSAVWLQKRSRLAGRGA